MPRPTWQHSQDTSTVWAKQQPRPSTEPPASSLDPLFVEANAIPWLLLQVVGHKNGPTGGHKLSGTTYIQRVNTSGGVIPTTGCTLSTDIGNKALVPYKADYYFFKAGN